MHKESNPAAGPIIDRAKDVLALAAERAGNTAYTQVVLDALAKKAGYGAVHAVNTQEFTAEIQDRTRQHTQDEKFMPLELGDGGNAIGFQLPKKDGGADGSNQFTLLGHKTTGEDGDKKIHLYIRNQAETEENGLADIKEALATLGFPKFFTSVRTLDAKESLHEGDPLRVVTDFEIAVPQVQLAASLGVSSDAIKARSNAISSAKSAQI